MPARFKRKVVADAAATRDECSVGRSFMAATGRALLFDIDGTLTDTDALHLEAFNQVFGPRGHLFDHARYTKELQGFSNAAIAERFLAGEPAARQAAIMAG